MLPCETVYSFFPSRISITFTSVIKDPFLDFLATSSNHTSADTHYMLEQSDTYPQSND